MGSCVQSNCQISDGLLLPKCSFCVKLCKSQIALQIAPSQPIFQCLTASFTRLTCARLIAPVVEFGKPPYPIKRSLSLDPQFIQSDGHLLSATMSYKQKPIATATLIKGPNFKRCINKSRLPERFQCCDCRFPLCCVIAALRVGVWYSRIVGYDQRNELLMLMRRAYSKQRIT